MYKTALMQPPNSKPHPTFLTKPEAAKFSLHTLCTMYQIITSHAFVGSYTQFFYPTHTPEEIACPCGKPLQTVKHMLLVCPLYTTACHKHLTISSHPQNLVQLLNHPSTLLHFFAFWRRLVPALSHGQSGSQDDGTRNHIIQPGSE